MQYLRMHIQKQGILLDFRFLSAVCRTSFILEHLKVPAAEYDLRVECDCAWQSGISLTAIVLAQRSPTHVQDLMLMIPDVCNTHGGTEGHAASS